METIRTTLVSTLIDILAVVLDFLTLQDKHGIRTLSVNIKIICFCGETSQAISHFCLFRRLVQINYIFTNNERYSVYLIKNWMHSFEVSLGYESVDRSTFSMKCRSASCWKCSSINAFIPPMKLQKNAFNSYNYI